ncbi:hypothetical protein [Streptomyces syringium]|uniref:Uncharacterized protein n=1 Tax=Streptomyces syringium TaxID=76729 RepID=A0ABS4XW08_9ACTN|nr:hypothetical protein [Streptomyces syringium]MBP2400701.1 hypothetical protein [Streptomyces syringium]
MSHALTAQFIVLSRVQDHTRIRFVHATDMEAGQSCGTRRPGYFTYQKHRAAWSPVSEWHWNDADETERRRDNQQLGALTVPAGQAGRSGRPGQETGCVLSVGAHSA